MANELQGQQIALLIAPTGTEQVQFTEPRKAVENAGASVDVISTQTGTARTMNGDVDPGDTFTVDKAFSRVSADDYDALIVPGSTWVDREVVTNQGLVTSRDPNDLPAFCAKIVEEFAEGAHRAQSPSA